MCLWRLNRDAVVPFDCCSIVFAVYVCFADAVQMEEEGFGIEDIVLVLSQDEQSDLILPSVVRTSLRRQLEQSTRILYSILVDPTL